jgi:hypothetical protein
MIRNEELLGMMNKSQYKRFLASVSSPVTLTNPTLERLRDKLLTARAQLVDPARIAAIDALLAAPEALAAMTPTALDRRILDIVLGK